jgi:ribosomal protein L3 glutamine methyltransferase
LKLSKDKRRDAIYRSFLASAKKSPVSVRELVRLGNSLFAREDLCFTQGMGNPLFESKYLTYFGLRLPYYEELHLDARVTEPETVEVLRLFEERIVRRVPAQYVSNEAFYMGWYFYVNENVLTPRTMIGEHYEKILAGVDWSNERVLDLCTGSGCIGITVAMKRPTAQVDLVDISDKALAVANKNIEKFNLKKRVRAFKSDLFKNVKGPYSLIITNPPYVDTEEYLGLPKEYLNEPRMALDAGPEGLDCVVPILEQAPSRLTPTGSLVVECGSPNDARLMKRFPNTPFTWWKDSKSGLAAVFSLKNGYSL